MNKIAYLILAHDDPNHLKRMINSLNYKADFFIHVDLKAPIKEFKKTVGVKSNVFWIENRTRVNWGGFNMIKATMSLLKDCLSTGVFYQRVVLLSGSDYPLKSNKEIYSFFCKNEEVEFIRAFNVTKSKSEHYIKHITRHFFMDLPSVGNKFLDSLGKKILHFLSFVFKKEPVVKTRGTKIPVYFGSQWWAITYECANELCSFVERNPSIYKYFKYSFAPDEKFFQTVIFNTCYKRKTINNGSEPFRRGTAYWANLHHIHSSLSKWYDEKDILEVLSSDKLFIRKVNTKYSAKLLDIIDSRKADSVKIN